MRSAHGNLGASVFLKTVSIHLSPNNNTPRCRNCIASVSRCFRDRGRNFIGTPSSKSVARTRRGARFEVRSRIRACFEVLESIPSRRKIPAFDTIARIRARGSLESALAYTDCPVVGYPVVVNTNESDTNGFGINNYVTGPR